MGFADVNYGCGMWEIVTLASDKQFMVGDSWDKTWGQSYGQFKHDLGWALSQPQSWPEKPTISVEQAKEISLETFSKANVELKSFELAKQELLNIGSDIVGVAYKDDPMWYFQWIKPEVKEQSPLPKGTFFFCYVHAHTGKLHIGPGLYPQAPSAKDACRLFLKTHPDYRRTYGKHADNISFSRLTEEEFRNLLPQLKRTFLEAKPSYPENTIFLKVEFPGCAEASPVIFVLNIAGHIDFAGIMHPNI